METVNDLIDKAREATQAESDNQLAIKLKVTRQAVSGWRRNAHTPDTVMCAKLAEITGIPLARVLGIVGEARAISREEKAVWRRLASAAAIAGIMLVAHPAEATLRTALTAAHAMHYAKSNRCPATGARQPPVASTGRHGAGPSPLKPAGLKPGGSPRIG